MTCPKGARLHVVVLLDWLEFVGAYLELLGNSDSCSPQQQPTCPIVVVAAKLVVAVAHYALVVVGW